MKRAEENASEEELLKNAHLLPALNIRTDTSSLD